MCDRPRLWPRPGSSAPRSGSTSSARSTWINNRSSSGGSKSPPTADYKAWPWPTSGRSPGSSHSVGPAMEASSSIRPRRGTRFAGGDEAYLLGPYEELLRVLQRDQVLTTVPMCEATAENCVRRYCREQRRSPGIDPGRRTIPSPTLWSLATSPFDVTESAEIAVQVVAADSAGFVRQREIRRDRANGGPPGSLEEIRNPQGGADPCDHGRPGPPRHLLSLRAAGAIADAPLTVPGLVRARLPSGYERQLYLRPEPLLPERPSHRVRHVGVQHRGGYRRTRGIHHSVDPGADQPTSPAPAMSTIRPSTPS